MVDILHRVGATVSPAEVYAALTTTDGLAGWWTDGHQGRGRRRRGRRDHPLPLRRRAGAGRLRHAGPATLRPDERVLWEVVDGPEEWIGTEVVFDLSPGGRLHDRDVRPHRLARGRAEFMHHCSTKWATFLMSLKQLVETGSGQPAPHDVQISNWH